MKRLLQTNFAWRVIDVLGTCVIVLTIGVAATLTAQAAYVTIA